jgi:hypothetical protein
LENKTKEGVGVEGKLRWKKGVSNGIKITKKVEDN